MDTCNITNQYLSKTVEGIFTTGVTSFGFVTLDQVTPRAGEIYKSMENIVARLDPKTTPPGLLEQYQLLLERYKEGSTSPGLEFISVPGLMAFPSMCDQHTLLLTKN
jgi:hypothetical protein